MENRKVRMGVIGLGTRGAMLIRTMLACEEAEVVALCDVYEDRVEKNKDYQNIEMFDRCKHEKLIG